MISVTDAIGIIEGCIEANDKRIRDREHKERMRRHKEETDALIDALMVQDERLDEGDMQW